MSSSNELSITSWSPFDVVRRSLSLLERMSIIQTTSDVHIGLATAQMKNKGFQIRSHTLMMHQIPGLAKRYENIKQVPANRMS